MKQATGSWQEIAEQRERELVDLELQLKNVNAACSDYRHRWMLAESELKKLRPNHNLTEQGTNHKHAICPCRVPPTPHCNWCGSKMDPPTPAAPIRNTLPAQCFSCHSFTMFIAQEGCGRDKGTTCPRGLDVPAKTAREYNQDMLAAREAAVMNVEDEPGPEGDDTADHDPFEDGE